MSQIHEHESSTDSMAFSFDRETLGALLVRHPWAVRFLAFEAALLGLAAVIPFVGSGAFYYVAFGMLVSVALLTAVVAGAIVLGIGIKRLRRELPHATL